MRLQEKARSGKRPAAAPSPCRIWVGTSGYSYTQWSETGFYPPDAKPGRMLPLYARKFPITELNQPWYQMPRAESMERQRRQAPPWFRFTAKLNRELTHDPCPDSWRELAAAYRHGIAPLIQSGQLMAVLIQLPGSFDRSVANRRRLAQLLDELEGLPIAVEFRQGSWNNDRVFAELEKRGAALAAVDEPDLPGLFPPLDVVTNPDFFYIRFHGRNRRGWRSDSKQAQFDYDYGEAELREWVEDRIVRMAGRARQGVIFFNNHVRGQAPQNAQTLIRLLREYGLVLATD